ncbi:sigma 54-interacting transcriptional regulator [Anaerosalibacter massiliensis]|uniref:Sigma 54-interacting transcriptional regulator n=1 Tax=Anaerosalibacter massiliensis TaxID=1347392 RepID=A0A9X2MQ19_9FIRM|nr:sigma 54-interacting transcriptional regulator [Anaerosalibacter massiliensis]MCR2045066.1 sigma 54-interacting transcriptional regulator [Anaerosalibacter massiliensis]
MLNEYDYVEMFTNMMSEGFIVIDNNGIIQVYNNKAKDIFGILHNQQISHKSGQIENGDIVIIGDNAIGKDDGNLTSSSLRYIGVEDENIEKGDALIVVGVYGNKDIKPVYLYQKSKDITDTLKMNTSFLGVEIGVVVDFVNKIITIEVDSEKYTMTYINYIGHMVILDGQTKRMKFYQAQGYTAKGESVNEILEGKSYRAKGENSELLNVIGKNIFEIHKSGSTIKEFYEAGKGKNISYVNEFKEINGFPTICTLLPVNQGEKRLGAALKVEDISEIKRALKERDEALSNLEKMERKLDEEREIVEAFPNIIGESKEINYVKKLALKASKTNSTVLILGESGTGKNLLARAIHDNSSKKDKPFIHVNCGAIPENLLESELFGYEKGAFTGASNYGKKGFFELANGGTIFLDEIGEISPSLQVKLLQVLQDGSFYKVGGQEKVKVDLRIISATNKNLEEEMIEGRFREDLYYRINVFPIWVPPLRDRKEDIYLLVKSILPKICKKVGCKNKRISGESLNILLKHSWPGNVRELENILERAANLSEENTILSKHLTIRTKNKSEDLNDEILPLKKSTQKFEKRAIKKALEYYEGDKKKAMKALGIGKTTFYEKIKKYNINN